jgi:SPP1 family predicted phage head-tail adaptor
MRAGSLRHRVTIQARTDVPDGHGGTIAGVTTICARVAAFVEPLGGKELERAVQIDPRSSTQITMRFRRDVQARQIAIYHDGPVDRPFEIVGSPRTVEERRREMVLTVKEAA